MSADRNSGWKLRGNYETKPGVASFPERPTEPLLKPASKYVLLKTSDKADSVAVEVRESAEGNVVFVYPGTLDASVSSEIACSVIPKTPSQHRRYLLCCTSQGRLALLGLFLGVSGILIDGSLKIGAAMQQPLIVIDATTHASLLGVATILQAVGLGIVFARTFRRSDF